MWEGREAFPAPSPNPAPPCSCRTWGPALLQDADLGQSRMLPEPAECLEVGVSSLSQGQCLRRAPAALQAPSPAPSTCPAHPTPSWLSTLRSEQACPFLWHAVDPAPSMFLVVFSQAQRRELELGLAGCSLSGPSRGSQATQQNVGDPCHHQVPPFQELSSIHPFRICWLGARR